MALTPSGVVWASCIVLWPALMQGAFLIRQGYNYPREECCVFYLCSSSMIFWKDGPF
jgi:hypothetical protein